jgi:hypothetical protein
MKTPDKIIGMLIALIVINVSITTLLYSLNNGTSNFIFVNKTSMPVLNVSNTDDPNLQTQIIKNGGDANLNISFNGIEGSSGSLSIYNASSELVMELQITLKPSPDFTTVNLGEFAEGTYTCNLTTTSGVHVSHFTIN